MGLRRFAAKVANAPQIREELTLLYYESARLSVEMKRGVDCGAELEECNREISRLEYFKRHGRWPE